MKQSDGEQRAAHAAGCIRAPVAPSPTQKTEDLSDMGVRNPAPDASPSREPTGIYRIIRRGA